MTRAELLAQADTADREADRLFTVASAGAAARTKAAKEAGQFFRAGEGFLHGEGQADNVARASELRREARRLRAEANAIPETSFPNAGVIDPPATPPPAAVRPAPTAGILSKPIPAPAVDPVDATVARIMRA